MRGECADDDVRVVAGTESGDHSVSVVRGVVGEDYESGSDEVAPEEGTVDRAGYKGTNRATGRAEAGDDSGEVCKIALAGV